MRTAAALAGVAAIGPAWARYPARGLDTWLRSFKSFPGATSFRIDLDRRVLTSDSASSQLFVASAIKTFILCQYLREAESGTLSEDDQLPVDDSVRTDGSPVFAKLEGSTPGRSVLEAMITHSDNTATDIALLHVRPDRVRAFIAEQGLSATLIPDSTRRFFSYNAGAPLGVDIGWSGVKEVLNSGRALGPPRRPLNDQVTLASSADDFVTYYKRAFAGSLFTNRSTLLEFKRIHMSNTFFPDDTIGYGKGGSGNWFGDSMVAGDFHALSYAGQMVVNATPVTFCFVANWTSEDPKLDTEEFVPAFTDVVQGSMGAIKQMLLR